MARRKHSLSSWTALLVAVSVCIVSTSLVSAETIRVAILQQVESVSLASSQGIIVRTGSDKDDGAVGRSLTITIPLHGSGMLLDDQRLQADRVELRGRNGELSFNGMSFPGRIVIKRQNSRLLVVNSLDLEDYIKGVVPAEMNSTWHSEALKAQAIAARTYALYQIRHGGKKDFDILSSTKDQVYRGRNGLNDAVTRAVDQTRNLVLVYDNAPIFSAYHSTAAGPTEDAMYVWSMDVPYLKGVECPFDMGSPNYQWRTDVSMPQLERRLREEGFAVGVIAAVDPASYSKSGRVAQVRIIHSDGELYLRGEDLRRVIGYTMLASTQFDLEMTGLQIQFTGRGAGHAVGLCQWGAKELAEGGYSAATIVRYYYPGTELQDLRTLPRP